MAVVIFGTRPLLLLYDLTTEHHIGDVQAIAGLCFMYGFSFNGVRVSGQGRDQERRLSLSWYGKEDLRGHGCEATHAAAAFLFHRTLREYSPVISDTSDISDADLEMSRRRRLSSSFNSGSSLSILAG